MTLPIQVGPATVTLNRDDRVIVCQPNARIDPAAPEGFFARDTRFVSGWDLFINGRRPVLLNSSPVQFFSARFEFTNDALIDATGPLGDAKADATGWATGDTLHANTRLFDTAAAGGRRVHSLWIEGTSTSKVPVTLRAQASDGYTVRIALLGPLRQDGTRATVRQRGEFRSGADARPQPLVR